MTCPDCDLLRRALELWQSRAHDWESTAQAHKEHAAYLTAAAKCGYRQLNRARTWATRWKTLARSLRNWRTSFDEQLVATRKAERSLTSAFDCYNSLLRDHARLMVAQLARAKQERDQAQTALAAALEDIELLNAGLPIVAAALEYHEAAGDETTGRTDRAEAAIDATVEAAPAALLELARGETSTEKGGDANAESRPIRRRPEPAHVTTPASDCTSEAGERRCGTCRRIATRHDVEWWCDRFGVGVHPQEGRSCPKYQPGLAQAQCPWSPAEARGRHGGGRRGNANTTNSNRC